MLGSEMANGNENVPYRMRMSKPDTCLMAVNFIEKHPLSSAQRPSDGIEKMGVLVVGPDSGVVAVDYSRGDNVHPVERCMLRYSGRVARCTVYVSRRPCYRCFIAMTQVGIERVIAWPLKAENDNEEDKKRVESCAVVRTLAFSVRVPDVTEALLHDTKRYTVEMIGDRIREGVFYPGNREIPLDGITEERWKTLYKKAMQWHDLVTDGSITDHNFSVRNIRDARSHCAQCLNMGVTEDVMKHALRLAVLLSFRSDYCRKPVGAVVLSNDGKQYYGVGWNGFPMKAEALDYDDEDEASVVAAEFNAFVFRNSFNCNSPWVFSSMKPTEGTATLLYDFGVRHFVYPVFRADADNGNWLTNYNDICQFEATW